MYSKIQSLRERASLLGWRSVLAEKAWRELGFFEYKVRPKGLSAPVVIRIGTSDIYEYRHHLGRNQKSLFLPVNPSVIVDAGANVGYAALRFQKDFPQATIIAIEPESGNVAMLRRNCAPYPNIVIEHGALWPNSTRLRIVSSIHTNGFQVTEDGTGDIKGFSLSDLMKRHKIDHIDLLKIDIVGSEIEVFSDPGLSSVLPHIDTIIIELHDGMRPGCTQTVEKALTGFSKSQFNEYNVYSRTVLPYQASGPNC